MNTPHINFTEQAQDHLKHGGSRRTAQVWATLAVAQAITDLAHEVMSLGTELHPINTWEQNK